MNIYNYIPSPDIAEHCEKIKHVFNPLEMAVIIANSGKPLSEKHSAWRELISDYPDMPIHGSLNFAALDSLHEYLREVITCEELLIADFYAPEPGAVYRFRVRRHNEWADRHSVNCSTFDKAWQLLLEHRNLQDDNVTYVEINKEYIDSDKTIEARFNPNGELLTVDRTGGGWEYPDYDPLDMIFIHLPVPFVKGDLVTSDDGEPSVLESLPHWDDRYERRLRGEMSDGSDMLVSHFLFYKGSLDRTHGFPYWNLRYYNGELKGQDRFLKCLSEYIKDEDRCGGIDWLLNAFFEVQNRSRL
jgi:hypothetical protein